MPLVELSLSTKVVKIWVQRYPEPSCRAILADAPFDRCKLELQGNTKLVFVTQDRQGLQSIAGILLVAAVTRDMLAPPKPWKGRVEWANAGFQLTVRGATVEPVQIACLNRPISEDLGRRFEFGELPVPTAAVFGVPEMRIPCVYWLERWREHRTLLLRQGVDPEDHALLCYHVLGMYAWRSRYKAEKVDSLLQLQLLGYQGDCEDQALEIARVIRSALMAEEDFPELDWLRRSVDRCWLVSGAANPCLEGTTIGHCWVAVQLTAEAEPEDFGLSTSVCRQVEGRLAYLEGTNPVSWGWTSKRVEGGEPSSLQGRLGGVKFNGTPIRHANKEELKYLSFLFDGEARYELVSSARNRPFEFVVDNASTRKSGVQDRFLGRLRAKNKKYSKEKLTALLEAQEALYRSMLLRFDAPCRVYTPDARQLDYVRPRPELQDGDHLILARDDPVYGPYWTLSSTETEDGPRERIRGSLC